MKRARHHSLTIKRKLEIIDKVESLPPGKKKTDIAAECDIAPSTLSTILKNKDKLQAKHAIGSNTKKRHRDPMHLEVDAALFQWFTAARLQSIPISGELLKAKVEELSRELVPSTSSEPWTCSSGWLSRWKVRHIKFRSICGENAAVDHEVCDDWKQTKLLPVLRRFDPSNIFNADETGLYWRLLPDKRKLLPVLRRFDPSNIFNADETELYWRLLPDKTHPLQEKCAQEERKVRR